MTGLVNAKLEPTLQVIVIGPSGQQIVDAVIDTGYTGFLTLQPAVIASLGLTYIFQDQGTLADGSMTLMKVYQAEVLWEGSARSVEVDEMNVRSLVGTTLLHKHEVNIKMVDGGVVTITPIP